MRAARCSSCRECCGFTWLPRRFGRDGALEGATESLSACLDFGASTSVDAFLRLAGLKCHSTAKICFGTILSKTDAVIEENVYVGPGCHLGLVHLERDVLVAAGVHIPSGARLHRIDDPTIPIREQEGTPCWCAWVQARGLAVLR